MKKEERLQYMYLDALLHEPPEKLQEPYKVDQEKYKNYEKALVLLARLKGQGKCTFSYDSMYEPYISHCIEIQWKSEDDMIELDAKEISDALSKFDKIIIDNATREIWQLYSTMYTEKDVQ